MKTVFLGGSRKISRLNDSIRRRLDDIVQKRMRVVVGDANGADRAMQRQLADWKYPDVTVYYVGQKPRNNEGNWPTQKVATPSTLRGAEFYAVKDRRMTSDAECGFMLWDGKSRGTLANVERLVEEKKPAAVYVAPARKVINVASPEEMGELLAVAGVRGSAEKISSQRDLGFEVRGDMRREGFSSRASRVREAHSGSWGSYSQDFARLATLLYGHSAEYSRKGAAGSSIYTLAGIPVLFSALRCFLIELHSGLFTDLDDDSQSLEELAKFYSDVRFVISHYAPPETLRLRLEILEQVRHEIVHPAHRPGEEKTGTPQYLSWLRAEGLLQSTGGESDYAWMVQLQSHKLFRWAFETIEETVNFLLKARSAHSFVVEGLGRSYGKFREIDAGTIQAAQL